MKRRNFIKISFPAILLTILVSGIVFIAPLFVENDPESLTVSVSKNSDSKFIGDIFNITINIRYPREKITVEPGDIVVDFRPLTVIDEPAIVERSGYLTVNYELRCLENPTCVSNKTYVIPPVIINYVENVTEKVFRKLAAVEPIYVSPRIDPISQDFSLRFPKEPLVKGNYVFFAALMLSGIATMFFWPITYIAIKRRVNRRKAEETIERVNKDPFIARIDQLITLLYNNSEPRLVLAQSDGLISDYLYAQKDISAYSYKKLSVLRRQIQSMAYQESDPGKEEVARKLKEISLVLTSPQETGHD